MTERLNVNAAAMLVTAAALYLLPPGELCAVLLCVLAHELGHAAAIWLLGLRIRRFRLDWDGFCMEYFGGTGRLGHAVVAAGGPAAGLLLAWCFSALGVGLDKSWLCLCSGLSLLLSLFNLLPALPLDGGRLLLLFSSALLGDRAGRRLTSLVSLGLGTLLLACGAWFFYRGKGAALLLAAVWLLFCQEGAAGLVKNREIK